jgi:hypothetical protein
LLHPAGEHTGFLAAVPGGQDEKTAWHASQRRQRTVLSRPVGHVSITPRFGPVMVVCPEALTSSALSDQILHTPQMARLPLYFCLAIGAILSQSLSEKAIALK